MSTPTDDTPRDPLAALETLDTFTYQQGYAPTKAESDAQAALATIRAALATRSSGDEALRAALVRLQRFTHAAMSSSGKGTFSFNDMRFADAVIGTSSHGEYGDESDPDPEDTARRLAALAPSSAPDVEGLDVERLARAWNNTMTRGGAGTFVTMGSWREVAAEYAALRDSRSTGGE